MAKEKFGAADEEIAREADEPVAECDGLGVSRSEVVGAILTAFIPRRTVLNGFENPVRDTLAI